jgi:hypothetical protein
MGNGTTRLSLLGQQSHSSGALPGRTPGSLGWQDVADPNYQLCHAGNTPGPVGTGSDLASRPGDHSHDPTLELKTLNVSLERTARFLFTVGWAEASNQLAKVSADGREVQLADHATVNMRARMIADRLMPDFEAALTKGPAQIGAFLKQQQMIRDQNTRALQAKFANAKVTNEQHVARLGEIIKFFARVQFVSTLGVKVIAAAAGGRKYVSGIEVAYDAATETIEAYFDPKKKVIAVLLEFAVKQGGDELKDAAIDKAVEKVAGGPKNIDSIGKAVSEYRVDADKLKERMKGIESKIDRSIEGSRTRRKLEQKLAKAEGKLTSARKALGRQAVGRGLGGIAMLVSLKGDIEEAWDKMEATVRSADGYAPAAGDR